MADKTKPEQTKQERPTEASTPETSKRQTSIDRTQIMHVAALASLSLREDEAAKLTGEIAAIVRYVDELASVDTSGVPPTAHVQLEKAAWRADDVVAGVPHDEALGQAPRAAQGGFAVPGFVDAGEG